MLHFLHVWTYLWDNYLIELAYQRVCAFFIFRREQTLQTNGSECCLDEIACAQWTSLLFYPSGGTSVYCGAWASPMQLDWAQLFWDVMNVSIVVVPLNMPLLREWAPWTLWCGRPSPEVLCVSETEANISRISFSFFKISNSLQLHCVLWHVVISCQDWAHYLWCLKKITSRVESRRLFVTSLFCLTCTEFSWREHPWRIQNLSLPLFIPMLANFPRHQKTRLLLLTYDHVTKILRVFFFKFSSLN